MDAIPATRTIMNGRYPEQNLKSEVPMFPDFSVRDNLGGGDHQG